MGEKQNRKCGSEEYCYRHREVCSEAELLLLGRNRSDGKSEVSKRTVAASLSAWSDKKGGGGEVMEG